MRPRPSTVVLLVFVALGTAVLVGLGTWQLVRNAEKQDLTRERDALIAESPLPAPEAAALDGDAVDYRRVRLDGEWDYANLQVIANRTRFGRRGEEVVVPLRPAGGGPTVLVNRGWYPAAEREAVLAGLAGDDANLEGLARSGRSVRATQAPDGSWTRFDVASIADLLPYAVVPWRITAGELVDDPPRNAPAERPVTGYEGFANTTPHVEYALTWYGLAVAMLVTAGVRLYRGSGARAGEPTDEPAKGAADGHEAA